jgi:hypothetical protein
MHWLQTIAVVFFAVSCSGNHVGVRKNSPGGIAPSLSPIDRPYKILGEAETRVSAFNLLWSAGVSGAPDFDRARRELIQAKSGDDIVQVSWFLEKEYWLLGTINILHLKATVIKFE